MSVMENWRLFLKSCAIHLKCFETELTKQLKR